MFLNRNKTRPVARQDCWPDIAHFVSGKFLVRDLDFDMTWVCVCVWRCGWGWRRLHCENFHQIKSVIRLGNNEALKT